MNKWESSKNYIFGDADKISSERYFVTITTVVATIVLILLCIFHLLTALTVTPVILAGSSCLLMLVLYYFVRFRGYLVIPKTILTIGGLIMLDFTWYSKFLSNGPLLLFILIFAALVIWVWHGKYLVFLIIFYFLNAVVLFYIDYNAPDILVEYPSREMRTIDIFLSFAIYSFLLIFLLYIVKKEFLRQKDKAVHSDKLKSAFLANMSHEIRTPMNGILGFSELMKEPNLSGEEQQQYIDIIQKSGHRMLNIINDIIDISKIEAGLVKLDLKESNINEQCNFIYHFFKPEAEAKGLKLIWKNSKVTEQIVVKTDPEKVYAVLTNLVKNALKYSQKGEIEMGYQVMRNNIKFYVKDTGIGIEKDRQQYIFERFIQADIEDRAALQGAGLGLSISKSYIEMLGGKIWVESEIGIGSTFYFTLPFHPDSIEKTVKQEKLISAEEKPNTLDLKILITEDDETSSRLISIIIKDICKEPLIAKTGSEAVDICRKNPDIDLILMDIQMPIIDGHNATRQIREFNKDVLIIAQTAFGLAGDKEKALNAGCNDYISKPIIKDELVALIQKYF